MSLLQGRRRHWPANVAIARCAPFAAPGACRPPRTGPPASNALVRSVRMTGTFRRRSRRPRSAAGAARRTVLQVLGRESLQPEPGLVQLTGRRSATRRPSSVRTARVPRPSRGLGSRRTMPEASSRSIRFVTLVACTCSRSPILDSGSAPVEEKVSSTSASYRAKVRLKGRSEASRPAIRICWPRIIQVTARIAA